jgi:uncharacterized membrane protein
MEAMNANAGQAATGAGLGRETSTHLPSRVTRRININRVERVDSVLLGGALLGRGLTHPSLRGISGRCYLYQVLRVSTARRNARRQVERSTTIGRSAAELYRFWHELGNRNRIMGHLGEVTAASKE